jgi:hypothetical protein
MSRIHSRTNISTQRGDPPHNNSRREISLKMRSLFTFLSLNMFPLLNWQGPILKLFTLSGCSDPIEFFVLYRNFQKQLPTHDLRSLPLSMPSLVCSTKGFLMQMVKGALHVISGRVLYEEKQVELIHWELGKQSGCFAVFSFLTEWVCK